MSSQNASSNVFTRRKILGLGGIGAIGGLTIGLGWRGGEPTGPAAQNLETPPTHPQSAAATAPGESDFPAASGVLRREDFLPHLNSEFRVGPSGATCTLVEVGATQTQTGQDARFISFSLLFSAPRGFAAESGIQRLVHGEMAAMELFLSPVGRADDRVHLEAVCSQRV